MRVVTPGQIGGVRLLVVLALGEETGENERALLRGVDQQLVAMVEQRTRFAQLRKIVEELRTCALPGGTLEAGLKAWFTLYENGGSL